MGMFTGSRASARLDVIINGIPNLAPALISAGASYDKFVGGVAAKTGVMNRVLRGSAGSWQMLGATAVVAMGAMESAVVLSLIHI